MPVPVNDADAVPPTSAQTAAPRHQNGASSPPQIGSPKSDKSLSRSGSLLDMLHLKDVHIPKPPPVK